MNRLVVVVLVVVSFILGVWFTSVSWWPWAEKQSQVEAQTILESIEKVTRLVTVTGHFSEVYDYKDYYGYDWSIFRKKALIRVKAKVLAGYDLDKIEFISKPAHKEIIIKNLPAPVILSVDHDLDYYDITEGTFNSFSPEDLSQLQQQAKNYVSDAAKTSDLLNQAEARGKELLETIRFMVESIGWRLVIQHEEEKVLNRLPN